MHDNAYLSTLEYYIKIIRCPHNDINRNDITLRNYVSLYYKQPWEI